LGGLDAGAGADLGAAEEAAADGAPKSFLIPFWAKYSRRRKSKSGSFKSSSRRRARSVEACLSFGISKRVADWKCLATPKNWTTSSVCFAKVL